MFAAAEHGRWPSDPVMNCTDCSTDGISSLHRRAYSTSRSVTRSPAKPSRAHLRVDRVDHHRMTMAEQGGAEGRVVVDVAPSVGVDQFRAASASESPGRPQ